jgi:serine/threonine protein kinase
MSKNINDFLELEKIKCKDKNKNNFKIGSYLGSGGFATAFKLQNNDKYVLRITHKKLKQIEQVNEEKGFEYNYLVKDVPFVCDILEYGKYTVKNNNQSNILCSKKGGSRRRKTFIIHKQTGGDDCNSVKKHLDEKQNTGYYGIIENCPGGELFDLFVSEKRLFKLKQKLDVQVIVNIMEQLLTGLSGMHKKNIAHLDLKHENVVLKNKLSDGVNIRIIDFGLSGKIGDKVTTRGTPGYVAPEVIGRTFKITDKNDIWAVGIMIMELLKGELIMLERKNYVYNVKKYLYEDIENIKERYKDDPILFDDSMITNNLFYEIEEKSSSLLELLEKMLSIDHELRPTAQQCLKAKCFSNTRISSSRKSRSSSQSLSSRKSRSSSKTSSNKKTRKRPRSISKRVSFSNIFRNVPSRNSSTYSNDL